MGEATSVGLSSRSAAWSFPLVGVAFAAAVGYWAWLEREEARVPDGIAVSSGVLSATQVPIATVTGGAVADVLVGPGVPVTAGTPILKVQGPSGEAVVATPRAGRVDRLPVQRGDRVESGQVVATVTDISELRMVVPFPATIGGSIAMGAEARLQLAELKDKPVPARVIAVTAPDGGSEPPGQGGRTLTVTLEVTDTRSLQLLPGQRGRVFLKTREGAPWPSRIR